MIKAVFYKKDGLFQGFRISGHSGYAEAGSDIVCASVSSAAMLAANIVTDHLLSRADVSAKDNILSLSLRTEDGDAPKIIAALCEHISAIAEDYEGTVNVTVTEV